MKLALFLLVGAVLALFMADGLLWIQSIDSCLDRGGVFDYAARSCRFDIEVLPTATMLSDDWPSLAVMLLFLGGAQSVLMALLLVSYNRVNKARGRRQMRYLRYVLHMLLWSFTLGMTIWIMGTARSIVNTSLGGLGTFVLGFGLMSALLYKERHRLAVSSKDA